MDLESLECASFLSYSVRGWEKGAQRSRDIMLALKNGSLTGNPPSSISRQVAVLMERSKDRLPFRDFFTSSPVLVPAPKSSLRRADDLWVPHQLADELERVGLGGPVAPLLERVRPLPKAAACRPEDRPTAAQHFESMAVQGMLDPAPESFLLVDDVVTRGATLLGAANRLRAVFPNARIRAFAAIRAISTPGQFVGLVLPTVDVIRLRPNGSTLRRPAR